MGDWTVFVRAHGKEKEHLIQEVTRVGRGPDCDVRISHATCSRHHFTLHQRQTGWELEHAHKQTSNVHGNWASIRTWVNGEQVTARRQVGPGDIITFKEEPGPEDVVIELGPSRDPGQPEAKKPWWKLW
jgi:pSer/pThr/pTyr-binding forkhead associated (FHA) protein